LIDAWPIYSWIVRIGTPAAAQRTPNEWRSPWCSGRSSSRPAARRARRNRRLFPACSQHSDYFGRGILAIRTKLPATLAVARPAAFVEVSGA